MHSADTSGSDGIGLWQLFTTLFGAIVGVGWVSATGLWIADAGPVGATIAFAIGAFAMLFIGLCFAELMGMYPDASGSPAFLHETFGEPTAVLAGWFLVLTYAATCAWFFLTLSWLLEALWPAIRGIPLYNAFGGTVHSGQLIIGLVGTLLSAVVIIRGVDIRQRFLDVLVVFMIAIGCILVLSALWGGSAANLDPLFSKSREPLGGIMAVAVVTPFFYAGFDVLPQVLRDRGRKADLSRIGFVFAIAIFLSFLFYAAVILSTASVMDRDLLVAATLPTFDAFNSGLNQPLLGGAVILAGAAGILTGWVAFLFSGARILHSLARAGAVPAFFAKPELAPSTVRTVAAVAVTGVGLGLAGRSAVSAIVEVATLPLIMVFVGICLAVLKLRRKLPDADRPYRVPFGWFGPLFGTFCGLGLLWLSLVPLFTNGALPISWMVISGWTAVGILFWLVARRRRAGLSPQVRRSILVEPAAPAGLERVTAGTAA